MPEIACPAARRVVVATHGHCFDGAASAALFSQLLRHLEGEDLSFTYLACSYGLSQPSVPIGRLNGDINAVLDFRYVATPNLHWYFDHHPTAFASSEERLHFENHKSQQWFHEPSTTSCAKLIADVARERFDWHDPLLDDLVVWADIIDSARFDSAASAIECRDPELQLMRVLEHAGNSRLLQQIVPALATHPVREIATSEHVQRRWEVLRPLHEGFIETVRAKSLRMTSVVLVDLTDEIRDFVGKFVTYALFPDSSYSVIVSRSRTKCRISVGFNPWASHPRTHDISAICTEYGGGGHAVVGAISLPYDEVDRAREAALTIAQRLDAPDSTPDAAVTPRPDVQPAEQG